MSRSLVPAAFLGSLVSLVSLASCSDDTSTLGNGSGKRTGTSGSSGVSSGGAGTSGSSGDNGTSGSGGTSGGTSPAEICVAAINTYRSGKGLPAYARASDMEACADGQAKSDGSSSSAHGAFGKCGEFAQNECPGWPGPPATMIPKCLEAMYGEGPGGGHYEAMLSTKYTKVWCGFGTAPDGQIWSVQNFR